MIQIAVLLFAGLALAAVSGYQAEIADVAQAARSEAQGRRRLAHVAGLFWLHEGANRFGKDQGNEIVLPDGPAHAGAFELHEGKVTVTLNGQTHGRRSGFRATQPRSGA